MEIDGKQLHSNTISSCPLAETVLYYVSTYV